MNAVSELIKNRRKLVRDVACGTYRPGHLERRQRSVSLIIENSDKFIWYRQRLHSLMHEWQIFRPGGGTPI